MSRGSRDDDRSDVTNLPRERDLETPVEPSVDEARARDVELAHNLDLPRGTEREPVECRGREYSLNGDEARALATIGAFRVIPASDLESGADARSGVCRHLADQGLIVRETLTYHHGAQHVVALTPEGKALLDSHSSPNPPGHKQEYYANVVKPRELRHDAQLYAAYRAEASRIVSAGGRVTRVVLDYEIKREYQAFLHRENRPRDRSEDEALRQDRRAFSESKDLPIVRGHLEIPDLRIEYETPDGRLQHRDVELVTEHYSRGQISGKVEAGFACYRSGGSSRGRGSANSRGATPFDPRHLERMS